MGLARSRGDQGPPSLARWGFPYSLGRGRADAMAVDEVGISI